mmetsp:Transcript_17286/g.37111  ORF Transcript_17286/g.37111 Transcript_17286/m.37111 type:complete len:358 (-) Transcript_17286:888-1961(-)
MLRDRMRYVLVGDEALSEKRDVLVVPGVPVGDGGAVRNAVDLVPVVPPRHHASVLGRVVAKPPVGLAVVVDHHLLPVVQLRLEHDLGLRQPLRQLVRVVVKLDCLRVGLLQQVDSQRDAQHQHRPVLVDEVEHLFDQVDKCRKVRRRLGQCGLALLLPPGRHLLLLIVLLLGLLLLVGVALLVARRERDEQPFSRVKQQLVEEEAEADPAERGGHRAEKDDQTRHLVGEVVGDERVEHEEQVRIAPVQQRDAKAKRRQVVDVVEVVLVRLLVCGLVLGDRVDERVAGACVLDKEAAHARGERAEVARGVEGGGDGGEADQERDGHLDAQHLQLQDGEVALAPLHFAVLEHLETDKHE